MEAQEGLQWVGIATVRHCFLGHPVNTIHSFLWILQKFKLEVRTNLKSLKQ